MVPIRRRRLQIQGDVQGFTVAAQATLGPPPSSEDHHDDLRIAVAARPPLGPLPISVNRDIVRFTVSMPASQCPLPFSIHRDDLGFAVAARPPPGTSAMVRAIGGRTILP